MPVDELTRAWRGGGPWRAEIERWTVQREAALPELTDLLVAYLSEGLSLAEFSRSLDIFSRRMNLWGFKGRAGQMFMNSLRASESASLNDALREALQAPFDEAEAERRIDDFVGAVERLREQARGEGRYAPKLGSIPYFLSFFWEAQDRSWPIYYPRSRAALSSVGAFTETGSFARRYLAFRRVVLDLAQSLDTTTWGVEALLFSLGEPEKPPPSWRAELAPSNYAGPTGEGQFEALVASVLEQAGLDFARNASLGGVRPDFVVTDAAGRVIVVEVKTGSPTQHRRHLLTEQIRLYREAIGADAAVIVMPGLDVSEPSSGILRPEDLVDWIASSSPSLGPSAHTRPQARPVRRLVFAAMPFHEEYEDVYFLGMAPAAEDHGATCVRMDHELYAGDVVNELKSRISAAEVVIGDVSLARPNVLYELGFAEGIGKPILQITSSPFQELPFDVRNQNTLRYARGQVHVLRKQLSAHLGALL